MEKNSRIIKLGIGTSRFKNWVLIIFCIFLILPIWNIGMGIIDYSQGDARLKLIGFPAPEFANIDQEYRLENQSLGCMFTRIEYLTSFRYNQTVKFLIKNFGYQKNSYVGIMPTKEEAKEFLTNGDYEIGKIEFIEDDKFEIVNASKIYQLDLKEQHGLVRMTIEESEINQNPKLKLLDECFIIQLNNNWIYVIELKKRKVIAQYRI